MGIEFIKYIIKSLISKSNKSCLTSNIRYIVSKHLSNSDIYGYFDIKHKQQGI